MMRREDASSIYPLSLSSRSLTRWLSGIVLALLAIHVGFQYDRFYTHNLPWELQALFDLDEEQSVPTWFSAADLGLAAALLAGIAGADRRAGSADHHRWRGMAWIALGLSLDEVGGIHETLNSLSPFSWTIPFGALAVVVAAYYLPFLRRQSADTRRGLMLAGALYGLGAVGVEAVAAQFFDETNNRQFLYALETPVEEGLEMFAVVLVIRTLLRRMERESSGAPAWAVEVAGARREPAGAGADGGDGAERAVKD